MNRRDIVSGLGSVGALLSTGYPATAADALVYQTETREFGLSKTSLKDSAAFLDSYLGSGRWSIVPDGASTIHLPTNRHYELHMVAVSLDFLKLANLITLPASTVSTFEVYSLDHVYRDRTEEIDYLQSRFIAKYQLNPHIVSEVHFRYRAIATSADMIVIVSDCSREKFCVASRYVVHPLWSGPKYDGT
jgi:hypothetical protein